MNAYSVPVFHSWSPGGGKQLTSAASRREAMDSNYSWRIFDVGEAGDSNC